jgi:hypothetical protein
VFVAPIEETADLTSGLTPGAWLHLLAFALLGYVRVLPYEQAATVQDR